jgi:DNA-binding MarR family transcriptional regulator
MPNPSTDSRRASTRPLKKSDFVALADFRATLRRFLSFSETGARVEGITPQQHQLLLAIKGRPDRDWATVSEIAEALQIRHHAAVGLVDRCARGGWVRREENPEDRRRVRVMLTASGEKILDSLSQRNRRELQKLRAALDGLLLAD